MIDDPVDRWRRSHRGPASDPEWPPKANDNWMEIMVVADGPMLKYHGDKLEQYILTLMQIVRNTRNDLKYFLFKIISKFKINVNANCKTHRKMI